MKATHGYAPVNGLKMYFEIEGQGEPLVFIRRHLAVAGTSSIAALMERHRVITFDLQGHGRTADIPDRPMSLEQNASDVIGLLQHLGVAQADFLGESFGGATSVVEHFLTKPAVRLPIATAGVGYRPGESR